MIRNSIPFKKEEPYALDYGLEFLCTADNLTSRWKTGYDRMDEILGCLCGTRYAGLGGDDDAPT